MHNNEHIGPLIKIADNYIEQHLNEVSEKLGLTSGQMHILHFICLNSENGVNQRKIEECFELSHATVSGIVQRLETKNFVNPVQSENDKRSKTVFPTKRALECDEEMSRFIEDSEKHFTEGFSEEEIKTLRNYLIRILANLGVNPVKPEGRE